MTGVPQTLHLSRRMCAFEMNAVHRRLGERSRYVAQMDPTSTIRRTREENATFVIDAIRELGITPHPQSRLMQMHTVLTEAAGIIHRDDPLFETALEAERDMQLLGFVFDQANANGDNGDFQTLVKRVLDDSVFPQDDRGQSKGRDFQFELFVAAVCQSAGLTPVNYAEPDVTCTVDGRTIGIAAKRLKNVSNLDKRVKKASQQIETSQLPGIIALDTCVALNRDNERIVTQIPDPEFGKLYKRALTRFLDDWHRKIHDWVAGKRVGGVVFHDHQVRFEPNGQWGLFSMTCWLPTEINDQQANREFESFRTRYVTALPNLDYV